MAGLLVLKPGTDWTVGGGLFDWTLEFLAQNLSEPEAVQHVREIIDNNLGTLWLAELSPAARREAITQLREHVVEAGERELPSGEQKPAVIQRLHELAEMARQLE